MCGHSFHPGMKDRVPGDPGLGGMAASASVSWSTPLAKMLQPARIADNGSAYRVVAAGE